LTNRGSKSMVADARCAMELGTAAFYGALEAIRVNLPLLEKNSLLETEIREEIDSLLDQVQALLTP
jgi:formiminotetrahydrofolate cyclodeaminase